MRVAPSTSLLGGSIVLPPNDCHHAPARHARPWTGEPGTTGTVAVVGAGKMGLPLAVQFASHGWNVIAIDIDPSVVAAINEGRSHIGEEPGVAELVAEAHGAGRLRATLDGAAAAAEADVIVLIVPVMLDATNHPDRRSMDSAATSIGAGLRAGSMVILETTLPVGDTRDRYAPMLAEASGLTLEEDLFVAFSPERLYSGAALRNLATYPKLVGGLGKASTSRGATFYASVLDAEVVAMSSAEAAEFAKLADTTYRDVNIALANELARFADRVGVDADAVIEAANTQPFSHLHRPGVAVGGHCIPVYPRFYLAGDPDARLPRAAREVNELMPAYAVELLEREMGGGALSGERVLVLGVAYRGGVKETAFSGAFALRDELARRGALPLASDPLYDDNELKALGFEPWDGKDVAAAIVQADHSDYARLGPTDVPGARAILDGRGVLDPSTFEAAGVRVRRIGRPRP
jgi:UDP-N-acetyl-D-mannosaminuronic acid dehydrogenase